MIQHQFTIEKIVVKIIETIESSQYQVTLKKVKKLIYVLN